MYLKKLISKTFKELQDSQLIQNQFQLITKSGKIQQINQLIPLRIGHRKTSPNFFRIYKKSNGKFIRFELEMKLETAKNFQFFLFAGQFETLESKLI